MNLQIKSVFDPEFATYGRVVTGYDFTQLLEVLVKTTDAPKDAVIYVPSDINLEAVDVMEELKDNVYGGMPIQLGYCNGTNTKLNCLEYHKDSEINIPAEDIVLLVAKQQDAYKKSIHSSKVEAFLCPKGTAVEVYATTMHYAPCSGKKDAPFHVVIVLPKGTNTDKPVITSKNNEDDRLFACNKWLIAHAEANEAKQGAVVAIEGENIDIYSLLD